MLKLAITVQSVLEAIRERWPLQKIATPEQAKEYEHLLPEVKRALKEAQAALRDTLKPLEQQEQAIRSEWRTVIMPLADMETALKLALQDWQRELERIELDLRTKAAEAQHVADVIGQPVMVPSAPLPPAIGKATGGQVQTRKRWTFEVLDFAAVPDAFKSLNEKAINEAVRKGAREIQGLRIYQTTDIVSGDIGYKS